MEIRELGSGELGRLLPCLTELAEFHNQVSLHFPGAYPSRPFPETLGGFSAGMARGISHIAAVETDGGVAGFCKIDIEGRNGRLDYLVVLKAHRGKGYGRGLMDWAMARFRRSHVDRVEVEVVEGNDAVHFYERFGFQTSARLLWYEEKPDTEGPASSFGSI